MPIHNIRLKLNTSMVKSKDIELEVKSDGAKLGTILVSRGNIEWLPANNSVNKYRLSWEKFAEVMVENGRQKKL